MYKNTLIALALFSLSASATTELYTDTTENVSSIKITSSAFANPSTDFRVVYSVPVTVLAGDLMHVMGQFEVTNYPYNVGVGCEIILASSPTDTVSTDYLAERTFTNLHPNMAHLVENPHGMKIFAEDWTGYVNLVVWAGAGVAGPSDYLTVEQGYGELDVALIR